MNFIRQTVNGYSVIGTVNGSNWKIKVSKIDRWNYESGNDQFGWWLITMTTPLENAGQLTLGANFDLSKIAGWENTTAGLMITKRDGNSLTSRTD